MEMAARTNRRESDADIAVRMLRDRRIALHYADLITEVLQYKGESTDISPLQMAQILTQINLDARFVHIGKGIWGLRDWNPTLVKANPAEKVRTVRAKVPAGLLDDLEDDLIDEDDEDEVLLVDDDEIIVDEDDEFADTDELEETDEDEDSDEDHP